MFEDKVIKPLLQDINAKDIALLSKNAIIKSEDNIFQYLIMHINAEIYAGAIFHFKDSIVYDVENEFFENDELESKIIERICEYYKERNFEVGITISGKTLIGGNPSYTSNINISWAHVIKNLKENNNE